MGQKKFNAIWSNQTNLGKSFGLSAIEIGKILKEHGLKDLETGKATQKALDYGYAKQTPLKNGTMFFMWHIQKVKQLISDTHEVLSKIDYWTNQVKEIFKEAERLLNKGEDKMAYIMSDFAYDNVPKKFLQKVKTNIEKDILLFPLS